MWPFKKTNQFGKKFKKIKIKNLTSELTDQRVNQDFLTNKIKKQGDLYNSWLESASAEGTTESEIELAASMMEIAERNKSRFEKDLHNSINETSLIQAAITIKENESKLNKGFIQDLYNASTDEVQLTLNELATISKEREIRMEDALDLMTKPVISSKASRSPEFLRNKAIIKEKVALGAS